ncbi:MAG: 50S ribosomal protein L3 [Clostridia bacterium]|nr:50S ribosomal protein L3 [Clostridia bacterium]MDD4386422.1 50S ribosomal protein L3 [Clostridia bacterium]
MVKEIYGKKLGMTQIFAENGKAIPVSVIEIKPCTIVSKKTVDKDGYNAIVVSFGEIKEKNVIKPRKGIFAKANVPVQRHLREIKVENLDEYEIGKSLDLSVFEIGDRVDVQGTSKGKGFQGVIKRHNQHIGPMTHGSMYHRRPGSMGATTSPGRVFKGKKLPGHMGSVVRSILNLDVVKIDFDKNVLLVKGSIPGSKKAIVRVRQTVR